MTITYRLAGEGDRYPAIGPMNGGAIIAEDGRGGQVGSLRWYNEHFHRPFEIDYIRVDPRFRRRGIATGMLRKAQEIEPRIRHSSVRTSDGDTWAKSTGDPVPIRGIHLAPYRGTHSRDFWQFTDDVRHIIEKEASYA